MNIIRFLFKLLSGKPPWRNNYVMPLFIDFKHVFMELNFLCNLVFVRTSLNFFHDAQLALSVLWTLTVIRCWMKTFFYKNWTQKTVSAIKMSHKTLMRRMWKVHFQFKIQNDPRKYILCERKEHGKRDNYHVLLRWVDLSNRLNNKDYDQLK